MSLIYHYDIGQLSREDLGSDNVFLIGFTTYEGTVMAGSACGAPMEEMTIPPAVSNSIEYTMNQIDLESFYLIFDQEDRKEKNLKVMGHRGRGESLSRRGCYTPRVLNLGTYTPQGAKPRSQAVQNQGVNISSPF